MTQLTALKELAEEVKRARLRTWWVDEEVAKIVGDIRFVSRLGIVKRGGSDRYFGPRSNPHGKGASIPSFTKDEKSKARGLAIILAKIAEPEATQ